MQGLIYSKNYKKQLGRPILNKPELSMLSDRSKPIIQVTF